MYNSFNNEKQTPWFLTTDEKPPKEYNPYTDEAEFPADEPEPSPSPMLPWETPQMYEYRRQGEAISYDMRKKEKRKNYINGAFFPILFTLFMMNSFSSAIAMLSEFIPEGIFSVIYNVHMILSYAALFPVTFFVYSVGKKFKAYTFFKKPDASPFYIARWTVIALGMTYGVAIFFDYLFELFKLLGLHVNELQPVPHEGTLNTVLYFITIVICAPIFEELLFRGFLLTKLSRFGAWFAIIAQGITFGLFHQNHAQLFFATAFGIICGFIAMRTRSIIPSIIAHIALNGYSFLSELFLSFTNYSDSAADPALSFTLDGHPVVLAIVGILNVLVYVLMIAGIVMLITEIAKNRAQFRFEPDGSLMSGGEKVKMLFSSVIVIVLLVILISNIITVSFIDPAYIDSVLESVEGYAVG